jgi:hypothetical protein
MLQLTRSESHHLDAEGPEFDEVEAVEPLPEVTSWGAIAKL